ncbi:hypothetical protein [Candidatus Nitrosocosmicus franklandus]|uniref:Uncharacterized protein n=1 Tax=Candidatus Nitrosocosmicus franklandianus TaxID=1798806 RepID=A0A484IBM0_9ARCH|nr:hypothetical protein [Candidatus Nitrosocosmicus franklandus]VFJ14478.1 protein of unknown function [Candidatus Nitrosocosmicus franklandus]
MSINNTEYYNQFKATYLTNRTRNISILNRPGPFDISSFDISYIRITIVDQNIFVYGLKYKPRTNAFEIDYQNYRDKDMIKE